MNILWRDNFGSFLDSSAPDASGAFTSAGTDAGADWSGRSLLWLGNDPASSRGADLDTVLSGGLDAGMTGLPSNGNWLPGQDMLWVEPDSNAGMWRPFDLTRDTGAAGVGTLAVTPGLPDEVLSLARESILFRFEQGSAIANSSDLDATLNQVLDVVWTRDGGTGQPPVTLPHAPSNPFADGSIPSFVSVDASALVWTGQPPGGFPDGTGLPPLTPPVDPNSPLTPLTPPVDPSSRLTGVLPEPTFATLAPQQLLWTDSSPGVPAILNDQPNAGVASFLPLFRRA